MQAVNEILQDISTRKRLFILCYECQKIREKFSYTVYIHVLYKFVNGYLIYIRPDVHTLYINHTNIVNYR